MPKLFKAYAQDPAVIVFFNNHPDRKKLFDALLKNVMEMTNFFLQKGFEWRDYYSDRQVYSALFYNAVTVDHQIFMNVHRLKQSLEILYDLFARGNISKKESEIYLIQIEEIKVYEY